MRSPTFLIAYLVACFSLILEPLQAANLPPRFARKLSGKSGKKGRDDPDGVPFVAFASGAQEVPPIEVDTKGQVFLLFSLDFSEMRYELDVSGATSNIVAAHLHCGAAGANGGVAVFLDVPPGTTTSLHSQGLVTNDDVDKDETGALCADTVVTLYTAILEGNVYLNVHTVDNGSGEVRGQIFDLAAMFA